MRIDACFDSHVHWAATGEFSERLRLDHLRSPADIAELKIEAMHSRGDWLLGFGWDEAMWPEKPTRQILDKRFPNTPVAFSRCDAHALWVNSEALKRSGLWQTEQAQGLGGRIEKGRDGWPTGILVDRACNSVVRLIPKVPSLSLRRHMLLGAKIFNQAGFTHIRDMTCDEAQWNEAFRLDESGLLTLAVEEYFKLPSLSELDPVLSTAVAARHAQSRNLRVMGVKLFLDGALGSEGAWLSKCYHGSASRGLVLWERAELNEVLRKVWEAGLEVAVHAIGDQAADFITDVACELKSKKIAGPLHIEHAELIQASTIVKMQNLQVICHLQPAHWLSDRRWLKQKLGDIADCAFPWRRLQESGLAFDFGSDSPIEPSSLARTFQALRESAEAGIPRLLGSPASHMSHRDLAWAPNSFTLVQEEAPTQVVFRGEHLL